MLFALLHGQAFFVLGLAIVLLVRRSARLELVRGLAALAVFGFCEALAAWLAAWLLYAPVAWLAWTRLLLWGVGYAFLLAAALQACLSPLSRRPFMPWLAAGGLLILWLLGLAGALLAGAPAERAQLGGEIAARYGLALPGGLAGMWGLRRQTRRSTGRARLPAVRSPLRIAGVALGFFALFGGLIGPAASFFPANWLNETRMFVPISLLRGLCGAALAYGVIRALEVVLHEIELWVENMERAQALSRERERIGRELHDGVIQSIYAAGLMLEGAQQSIPAEPETAQAQLARAIHSLNQTIQDIRRYIFDLRGEVTSDDLETGLRNMLKDFRANTLLETKFSVEGESVYRLGADRRQHIFQIAREALTNAARHAQARRVEVKLTYQAKTLQLRISDDGVGFAVPLERQRGEGLRNIRERARLLEGWVDIAGAPNAGVTLTLTVPY